MLSSFASYIPQALHITSLHEPKQPPAFRQDDDDDDDDDNLSKSTADHSDPPKSKDKEKLAKEAFIIVRPPPAKSNHPLNLQVQLVPPSVRAPSGVAPPTPDGSQEVTSPGGSSLSRTSSARSDTPSFATSTSSTTSFASVSTSSGGGRRTIIPLYNLQAHNVMTNVVVDAGTDAKIARFQKRGIELIDLALLEPVEVWGDPGAVGGGRSARPSIDEMGYNRNSSIPPRAGHRGALAAAPSSAGSSAISLNSTVPSQRQQSPAPPLSLDRDSSPTPASTPQATTPSGKRNIFGKLFKKNTPSSTTLTPTSPTDDPELTPTRSTHSRNISLTSPLKATFSSKARSSRLSAHLDPNAISSKASARSLSPNPSVDSNGHSGDGNGHSTVQLAPTQSHMESIRDKEKEKEKQLRPPVLGIQPTYVSSSSFPASGALGYAAAGGEAAQSPSERALMYVWLVRRWLKKPAGSPGGELLGSIGMSMVSGAMNRHSGSHLGGMVPGGLGGVEVRFEWKRAKVKGGLLKKRERGRGSTRRRKSGGEDAAPEEEDETTTQDEREQSQRRDSERKRRNRLSTVSAESAAITASDEHSGGDNNGGEESDAEDSETPWVCTLKIRRSAPIAAASSSGSSLPPPTEKPPPQVLRIKVGTLSPTPHHPKVVAMLKVPFPLPDIEVERMAVVRKHPHGPGGQQPQQQTQRGGTVYDNGLVVPSASAGAGGESHPQTQTQTPYAGITLTAEEIKDAVCTTGLWLVVREAFGGVGRVSRKGDGWRIRA